MELQYYYSVISMTETYTGKKVLVSLMYGKTLNDLAADIFNLLDSSLKTAVEGFNQMFQNNLDFNDPSLSGKCANKAFGIAPIIAFREKWKSGKQLTLSDFKNIDFFNHYDGSISVTFSRISETIRDLRDILASYADSYGFYDDLPSDFEMEIDESKIVNAFFDSSKKWLRENS